MVVKPSEYRKGRVKTITLTTGEEWKIKRLSFPAMARFFQVLGLKPKGKASTAKYEKRFLLELEKPGFELKLIKMAQIVVPDCSANPKVVLKLEKEESLKDTLLFEEIKPMHVFELFFAMLEHSGLSGKAAATRQNFRK